jgi:hypothetical protein
LISSRRRVFNESGKLHIFDARPDAIDFGDDLSCALPEFGDVRVANRAINEAPELEVAQALWIGKAYGFPIHGFHFRRRQQVSRLEFHGSFLLCFSSI